MQMTYYRSEYSDKQWRALIDTAAQLGCQVTYGKYGDRAVIDSTERLAVHYEGQGASYGRVFQLWSTNGPL